MQRCPICKNRAEGRAENRYAPFCSQRCKLIDLGNWLGEGYRIPEDAQSPGELESERRRPSRGERDGRRHR